MPAAMIDLTIEQGADFDYKFGPFYQADGVTPINFSSYLLSWQIFRGFDSQLPIIYQAITAPKIVGNTDGTISLAVPGADTSGMNFQVGYFRLMAGSLSGTVSRLAEGNATLS